MEVIWNASWLCLYLLWLATDGLSAHSCYARAKYGASVGDVFGFNGEIFDSFISHHFQKLGVSGVASHGLGLVCCNGILEFALILSFVALADGLGNCYGLLGLHVDVGEATTHAIFLLLEGDFFAVGSGDNTVTADVVANPATVCLKLGEGEKVCNAVGYKP